METSLAQQLKKLSAPQTSVALADARSRASILFDPKEAATYDRRAIYEIGLKGLLELGAINSSFKQFRLTLFDEATLTLERSVELKEVNKLLDLNISKFLRMLSPYFLLRPAHMCFEWLLRRFQVHEYNRTAVMELIFPYHETNTFVQVIQTMRLRKSDAEWDWLRPLQRPGVPLSKIAIVNRASSVPSFLTFVCKSTQKAVKELGPQAHQLQAQINFYATVVVGALQVANPVKDWHIASILESILKGLVSETVDFVAASYVVVAQLVSRTKLKTKVCNALLERVANCTFERLHTTALLLLVWIHDRQQSAEPKFTTATMFNLVCQKWLISSLASLAAENIAVQAICMPLVRGAVASIHDDHTSSATYKQFVNDLITDVPLSTSSALQLISCFLDTYMENEVDIPEPSPDEDTIVIDSDDEMEGVKTDFQSWYTTILQKLDHRYPEAFDLCVKESLKAQDTPLNRQKALKLALGFRLNTTDEKAKQAFEKLYHYNAIWRLHAVKQLLCNLKIEKKRARSYKLLQECLSDRIKDDNVDVVLELLSLSTAEFVAMLGAPQFAQILCNLLQRAEQERQDWLKLVPHVVQHLTSAAVSDNYDSNLVLLSLMPYLFPSETLEKCEHAALLTILNSDFGNKLKFLNLLKVDSDYSNFKVNKHRQHFLDAVASTQSNNEQYLSASALLESVEKHSTHLKTPKQFTHLLLLLTAYAKRELQPKESFHMLQRVSEYSQRFQFKVAYEASNKRRNNDFVPLQLYSDFLKSLIGNTKCNSLATIPWTKPTDDVRFCLLLLQNLLQHVYAERCEPVERQEWARILKKSLNSILPDAQSKLDMLSKFYMYDTLPELFPTAEEYTMLRVEGFKLLQAVLQSKKNVECTLTHVLRLASALSSPLQTVRLQALKTLKSLTRLETHVAHLVEQLLKRSSELSMDHEQYALILYTILMPSKSAAKDKLLVAKLRRSLLTLVSDAEQDVNCTANLLAALKHVNDEQTLTTLLPMGMAALDNITTEPVQQLKQLPAPHSDIYKAVVERFEGDVALNVLLRKPLAWELFEASFAQHDVYIQLDNKLQPLPCVILSTLTPETYERLQSKHKGDLLKLIVVAATKSDNDSIFLAAHKLLKRCVLECQPLVPMLTEMCLKGTRPGKNEKRRSVTSPQLDLTSTPWKQGMTLLELIEHKKHLVGPELLIPPLFDLLRACLALEEHSAAEYPKQIILSCLLHCCQTAEMNSINLTKVLPESCFRIEQVVQCLRNTQNPQTQQHALLFLTRCAALYPQQVLHKIVEIFTFVGSTVARHDDAFSLHIINKVVESIIPTLLQQPGRQDLQVIPVLKIFSDICTDVPVHRRLPLYATLFSVLKPKTHLWQFLCIVFEAQVLMAEKAAASKQLNKSNERMEFAKDLMLMFEEPEVILETCVRLLDYLAQLPFSNVEKNEKSKSGGASTSVKLPFEQQLFDVSTHSFKQLRHYKYLIVDFLSSITSCADFQTKLSNPKPTHIEGLKRQYQDFIIKTLAYITIVNSALNSASDTPSLQKFWRVISNHVHDILDNAIGLLSPEYFLNVIAELLQHQQIQVRVKVLELLITKFNASSEYFTNCETKHFGVLFAPLSEIITVILDANIASSPQQAQLQQTALRAIQLLSQRYGREYIEECRTLLATLTKITKKRANVPKAVLGNVVLTLVEICSSLKAHALAQLPKFMPQLTELLKEQVQRQPTDYLCSALITALQKLFAALPLFLGPYLVDIITALLHLSTQLSSPQLAQDKRGQALQLRLVEVWSSLANGVEARILVPSCCKTYTSLLESQHFNELTTLMQLLLQSINHNTNAQLQTVQDLLSELFLQALEFRLHVRKIDPHLQCTDAVEASIIEAFVAWILKLSETSFRPVYAKVSKWALHQHSAELEPTVTFFLLTSKIADALKSLFVLFAGNFIEDAAKFLNKHNTARGDFAANGKDDLHIKLIAALLGTLHNVFLHNSGGFVNSHRFNILMQPIVDQLENELVLHNDALQQTLSTCIAQLAVAVSDDVMWKQLNNQVLLKTRTPTPEARILSFNSCVAIARQLGESFSSLLPETMPFIAELLEDENQRVEKNTRTMVQELETILGEPVQKYL